MNYFSILKQKCARINEEYGSKLLFENFHMLMEKKRVLELVLTDRSAVPSFLEDLKNFKNEFLQKAYIQVSNTTKIFKSGKI